MTYEFVLKQGLLHFNDIFNNICVWFWSKWCWSKLKLNPTRSLTIQLLPHRNLYNNWQITYQIMVWSWFQQREEKDEVIQCCYLSSPLIHETRGLQILTDTYMPIIFCYLISVLISLVWGVNYLGLLCLRSNAFLFFLGDS